MRWAVLSLALCALLTGFGVATHAESQALISRYIGTDPPTYRMGVSLAEAVFGHNVAIWPVSTCECYVADQPENLVSATWFQLDRTTNRFIFMDVLSGPLRSFGHLGQSGDSSFWRPTSIDCQTILDDPEFEFWQLLFVADSRNDRVRRFRFSWPYQYVLPTGDFAGCGIYRPLDIDVNNGGTFSDTDNDFLLVLNANHTISGISTSGDCMFSFGGEGSGYFEFQDPTAIACGRWPFQEDPFDPYASTRSIFVADAGNDRLVKMHLTPDLQGVVWDTAWYGSMLARDIVDLDVDNNGHVWAVLEQSGSILKFTWELHYLTAFGSSGFGPNQFNRPQNISNTGGHLGCGNMYVVEEWTDSSGGQYFAIGTDIEGLTVSLFESGGNCIAAIILNVIDFSSVVIEIYNQSENLVKTLFDGLWMSDWHYALWDGRDEQGYTLPADIYEVKVTASSRYFSVSSGEPTNTVVKELSFYYNCTAECPPGFFIGDADGNGHVDIDDNVYLIAHIFSGGPSPTPYASASGDANCSCTEPAVDIDDVVYLIAYIFSGGPAPCTCQDWIVGCGPLH
jgi:hypothetical protein